jgi:hypothetical protein
MPKQCTDVSQASSKGASIQTVGNTVNEYLESREGMNQIEMMLSTARRNLLCMRSA